MTPLACEASRTQNWADTVVDSSGYKPGEKGGHLINNINVCVTATQISNTRRDEAGEVLGCEEHVILMQRP